MPTEDTQVSALPMRAATMQMYDRRVVGETERGVAYDALGREAFRKMGLPLILEAVPSLAGEFTPVPLKFWTLEADDDGYGVVQVACPCGDAHRVILGHLHEAPCERFFYALGDLLLVANSPTPNSSPVVD